MCLYIDYKLTNNLVREGSEDWIFHKLFIKYKGSSFIETPYHNYKVYGPGLIEARLTFEIRDILDKGYLEGGLFHARTSIEATKQDTFWVEYFTKGEFKTICLPIKVKISQIICFGMQDDVGISAYEISEENWRAQCF